MNNISARMQHLYKLTKTILYIMHGSLGRNATIQQIVHNLDWNFSVTHGTTTILNKETHISISGTTL